MCPLVTVQAVPSRLYHHAEMEALDKVVLTAVPSDTVYLGSSHKKSAKAPLKAPDIKTGSFNVVFSPLIT